MLSESADLAPVTITFERHHEFEGRRVKNARCRVCKRGQHFIEHLGFPEPLDSDAGTDPMKWQGQKKAWQEAFGEVLHLSGLPRGGIESVQLIVKYTFGQRGRRDRDNIVYPFCKFFGDTLVRGRYWTLPYEAIDWTDAGMMLSEKTGKPLKTHRRVRVPAMDDQPDAVRAAIGAYGREDAWIEGSPKQKSNGEWEPVYVRDPLGGWIVDDRWDRFEVIEMQAVYVKGVEALEVMVLPSAVAPGPWPPSLSGTDEEDLVLTASLGAV